MKTLDGVMEIVNWTAILERQDNSFPGDKIWVFKDGTFEVLAEGQFPQDEILAVFHCDSNLDIEGLKKRFLMQAEESFKGGM